MPMFVLRVHLPHEEREIEVASQQAGRLLTDVLRRAGVPLNTRCGHRGLCDGCLVELQHGSLQHGSLQHGSLQHGSLQRAAAPAAVEPQGGLVRGCQWAVPATGTAEITVPPRSLLAHQPQVVASFRLNVSWAHDPLWQRIEVNALQLDKNVPLHESLLAAVTSELDGEVPIEWLDLAGATGPDDEGQYRLVVEHHGDRRLVHGCELFDAPYGLAVDIGTTTIVVALVNLVTGEVVADASGLNAQTRLGDNVLTRINLCMTQPRLISRMQQAVGRSSLAPLIALTLREAEVDPQQLACMVVAGNTTMLHLLLGVDPTSLGTAPFTAAFLEHKVVSAGDLPLSLQWQDEPAESDRDGASVAPARSDRPTRQRVEPQMAVHLLPGAAGYVGADITAGVLASGMGYRDDTCLLVDLGTNGEIVLRHKGQTIGCATAAGPAFEGAGLRCGMRAGDGAVGHIWLDGDDRPPRVEVIGRRGPIGICGTAYIDFVARARQRQWISSTARFVERELPNVVQHERHGRALVVAKSEKGEELLITEADMASLLQAKAAIAAGITCLLRHVQLRPSDVSTVFLAGGFGFHMHVDSLLGCGMLPGFRAEQVETVGNSALAGAYLSLVDSGALCEIRRISSQMEIIELNLAPDFEMIYIEQLMLP